MLEFARELYCRSPPNCSAWSAALESFLERRGYNVTSRDSIRRKFTKASRYYSLLLVNTELDIRERVLVEAYESQRGREVEGDEVGSGEDEKDEWDEWDAQDLLVADYLSRCCPGCFGGLAEHDERAP